MKSNSLKIVFLKSLLIVIILFGLMLTFLSSCKREHETVLQNTGNKIKTIQYFFTYQGQDYKYTETLVYKNDIIDSINSMYTDSTITKRKMIRLLSDSIYEFNYDYYNYMFQYAPPSFYHLQHAYPVYLKINSEGLAEKVYPVNPLLYQYNYYDSLIYANKFLIKIIRKYNIPTNYPYSYNAIVSNNTIVEMNFTNDSIYHDPFDGDIVYTGSYQIEYDTSVSTISINNFGFSFFGNSNEKLIKKIHGTGTCTNIFYGLPVNEEYRYTYDQNNRVQNMKVINPNPAYRDSIIFTYY